MFPMSDLEIINDPSHHGYGRYQYRNDYGRYTDDIPPFEGPHDRFSFHASAAAYSVAAALWGPDTTTDDRRYALLQL